MTIELEPWYGKYRMTLSDKNKKRRTNRINNIRYYIDNLPNDLKIIKYLGDDVVFLYPNLRVILRNYQKYKNNDLYSKIFDSIPKENATIVRIKANNKNKMMRLIVTGALALTIGSFGYSMASNVFSNTINDNEINSIAFNQEIPTDVNLLSTLEENYVDESNYELLNRIEQTKKIQAGEIVNNASFSIGSDLNEYTINKINDFINSSQGEYCFENCDNFGVDPYLFVSLIMQESSLNHADTIPTGKNYNGNGVGICQLENPSGETITAFNYTTSQNETEINTMASACQEMSNIKMGIMSFQNVMKKYNGNIYLALQSYNYGKGLVDAIICTYADEIGSTYEEVVKNKNDFGWMKYVEMVHKEPQKFANMIDIIKYPEFEITKNYLINWSYDSYGDANYISNVLRYYIGFYSKYKLDNDIIETNLLTGETITKAIKTEQNLKIS